ncbi:MAG: gamma-glutamylcyclotransferase family protein [Bacteroidota bacterium]
MKATQYLFSYGTLQNEDIQRMVLGRTLKGKSGILLGYRISQKKVHGKYPLIEPSPIKTDNVRGKLFRVSNFELHELDHYETYAYMRIEVELKSGTKAWVYVENLG